MDLHRLPPLSALRAFAVAARYESFTAAARALFVTHSAVSHQIRGLEDELGVALFERHGKRVRLTSAGRKYAERVDEALVRLAEATRAVRVGNREQRLTISTMPSFAARWLTPRIGEFIERHPELELELLSSHTLVDFAREDVDVAIRMGSGQYPGLYVEKLLDDVFFPACSPDFRGGRLPQKPADLRGLTLLRSDNEPWRPWFLAAGLDWAEPRGGAMYEDSSLLLLAASQGQGVALVRSSLAYNELASGKLVRLFDIAVPCPWEYYFVCPPPLLETPKMQAFRTWLLPAFAAFAEQLGEGGYHTPAGGA